jgi:hypothetical protein
MKALFLLVCVIAVCVSDVIQINHYVTTNCTGEPSPRTFTFSSELANCERIDIEDRVFLFMLY